MWVVWLHNGNYGTLLQAYALQRFLRGEGYDVSNINYKPSTIEKAKNLIKCHNSFSLFKEKFDGYLSKKQGQPELLCQRNHALQECGRVYADRCLCVDEKGNVITGDHILYIYGCYMKERGKLLTNTVVTTVMSNFGLYKAFDEQGIGYAKTAVGDKYVYEYMAKNGCRIGGEQSGHIIFSKYASTGDGILTSLKMMEVMLAKKKPMSELAAPLKIYPQVLENMTR